MPDQVIEPVAPPTPTDAELDSVYQNIRNAEPPSAVAQLTSAVNLFTTEQRQTASRMLAAPDHYLDRIRYNVRSGLEPVITAFDEQLAAVGKATNVTLTPEGTRQQSAAIHANREAASKAVLDPAREELQALITQTEAQLASTMPQATDADRDAAAEVAYRVAPLMPNAALNELARVMGEAVTAKEFGRVTALLPYLDSLAADPKYETRVAEVQGLIEHVRAVSASWQVIVARARRERLDRLDWELQSLSADVFSGPRGAAQQWFVNQPGWNITSPPPAPTPSSRRGLSSGRDFKMGKISAEQRTADKAARRKQLGQDDE